MIPVGLRPRRLAYLGTPDLAVPPLRALVEAGFEVAVVVTRPDTRRGRGGATSPSPVSAAATDLGLPVSHDVRAVVAAGVELGVVVAYGRLIPDDVLAAVPMVNLHFSALPRWRGAAPVERALLAGDTETAVDLMEVVSELDAGGVLAEARIPIGPEDTVASLRAELVARGTGLLLTALTEGLGEPRPQVGTPVHAAKLTAEDLALDWSAPARVLDRQVRVGGAWTTFRGRRLKVWTARPVEGDAPSGSLDGVRVGTGSGLLELIEVQPEGRARQAATDWVRGARPDPDDRLGR